MMVIESSLPILTQAFGMAVAVAAWAERSSASGSETARTRPPPAAALAFRKSRRESVSSRSMSRPLPAGRHVDGGADARIGAAAADVARHGLVDVGVGGRGPAREQRRRAHDLPRLAVAALRHVEGRPRRLDLLAHGRGADGLDGGD